MPHTTSWTTAEVLVVILLGVDFVDVVHYTLVGMVALAALMTLWFAGYVVYRLHQD